MKFTEEIQSLIAQGEIQDASTNMLEDAINAVLGDPISTGKIMIAVAKSPFFIRDQIFGTKMEIFLNGVYLDRDDCAKLCAVLTEDEKKQDNALRLMESIDRAETQQKIQYLINATRCLLTGFINRSDYFRICHAITHNLEEDLIFLSEHIKEENIPYSTCVQGLLSSGLMHQSIIDATDGPKHSFTPIAKIVDRCAVSYENIERYPDPTQPLYRTDVPRTKLSGILEGGEKYQMRK